MSTERTLVLVKPDGVQRGLIGQVLARLEARGLKLIGLKLMQMDEALANRHYAEHVEKPFFPGLRDFITSGPLVAAAFEGSNAVQLVRNTMGATNPLDATPGSIRAGSRVTSTSMTVGPSPPASASAMAGAMSSGWETRTPRQPIASATRA